MTTTVPVSSTDKNLDAACVTVAGEISRTDSKASLLLAFDGAVIAGLAQADPAHVALAARLAGAATMAALTVAAVFLLLVVRPRLGGGDRASFPYWARCTPEQIRADMADDRRVARLHVLSQIAMRKFRGLRWAVDLSLAAIACLVLTALAALWEG